MQLEKLIKNADAFSFPPEKEGQQESLRQEFINKFPKERIRELTIDEYVSGQDRNGFCYWLEFKKILFGCGGGSASKFGLFKSADGNFYESVGSNKTPLEGDVLNNKFQEIKNQIAHILELAEKDKIADISKVETPIWPIILQKILVIYFPNKFLNMGNYATLLEIGHTLDLDISSYSHDRVIELNYDCNKQIVDIEPFKDWGYVRRSEYFWKQVQKRLSHKYFVTYMNNREDLIHMISDSVICIKSVPQVDLSNFFKKKKSQYNQEIKQITTNRDQYNLFKHLYNLSSGDYIALCKKDGAEGINLLSIVQVDEGPSIYSNDPDLGHIFRVDYQSPIIEVKFNINPGTQIFQEVKDRSLIDQLFNFNFLIENSVRQFENWLRDSYKKRDGESLSEKSISNYLDGIKTIDRDLQERGERNRSLFLESDINQLEAIQDEYFSIPEVIEKDQRGQNMYSNAFSRYLEYFHDTYRVHPETVKKSYELSLPLNTILYGPPGTGKTYSTMSQAVKIVEELDDSSFQETYNGAYEAIKDAYNKYVCDGRITFVTFHQSFSYEDFVEGIKPIVGEQSSKLGFEVVPGVFSEIVEKANNYLNYPEGGPLLRPLKSEELDSCDFYKISLGNSNVKDDDNIFNYCFENDVIALGYGDNYDLSKLSDEEIQSILEDDGYSEYASQAVKTFRDSIKIADFVIISWGLTKARLIGKVIGDYYYNDQTPIRYNHFRKVEWISRLEDIPVNEFYEIQFAPRAIYSLNKHYLKPTFFLEPGKSHTFKNHVLIIDEINRGNVAQVFGELITLIEPDKRKGAAHALSVKLPYSQKDFSVPENLYILGTMNTADRSVEALDTALRRRFSFKEMYPDPSILDQELYRCEGIELSALLRKMNARIEKLLDKDYCIGHSYFMGIKNKQNPRHELKEIFRNKIIPLLQEYFYGDWSKIRLVLGGSFVIQHSNTTPFAVMDEEYGDFDEKTMYSFVPAEDWTIDSFRKIYDV